MMTESTIDEGTQDANSDVSQSSVKPISFDPEKFARDLTASILAKINDPAQIQSQKDRVIAAVKKDKGMREVLAEVEAMEAEGLTRTQIKQEMRLRELEARTANDSAQQVQSPGKAVAPVPNNPVNDVISALGLDMNDPEVTGVMAGGLSFAEQVASLAGLSGRKAKSPNPTLVSQPAGGSNPSPNIAQLETQYKNEVMSARGKKDAREQIHTLREKYRNLGVNTDNIGFSV
jgi:hypothetical protein